MTFLSKFLEELFVLLMRFWMRLVVGFGFWVGVVASKFARDVESGVSSMN